MQPNYPKRPSWMPERWVGPIAFALSVEAQWFRRLDRQMFIQGPILSNQSQTKVRRSGSLRFANPLVQRRRLNNETINPSG
ncbi:MAG: hypothetical protein ACKER6_00165 [Candidatus Hodgkinia cicadicola]